MNILNVGLAFIEGVGLVVSPCILPILPIMLAASLDGGKKRPLGIITGFIIAFAGFALLSRQLLEALHADPQIVRNVALAFLVLFGIVMLSQKLSDWLVNATQGLANAGQNLTARWDQKNGYVSGVAIGAMIGLIWTPCAGPIMAAAVVNIIQARDSVEAALTVTAFALGAGLPMLMIALTGRRLMNRLSFLKTHSHAVRRILGVIIIAVAALIYSGADVWLLSVTGGSTVAPTPSVTTGMLRNQLDMPYPAPELAPGGAWLNGSPLTLAELRGKVVLIDFWTYSCINCVRTLPTITRWDADYRDKGLVIIGIHSPEFGFEKNINNVKGALEKYGIHYPVVLDNQLANWTRFKNQYWPAHYLIDQKGNIVYTHFGEGDYDITENNIRALLGLDAGQPTMTEPATLKTPHTTPSKTPETYLGYARAERYVGMPPARRDINATYRMTTTTPPDHWSLNGKWKIESQKIVSGTQGAQLRLYFHAAKVFLVMGTADNKPAPITLMLNGKALDKAAGKDVTDNTVNIKGHALYELVNMPTTQHGLLDITASTPGVELYAFTFGDGDP